MFNFIKDSFKPKYLKKASLLVVLMLFLTFSGCSFNNQSSLTASSQVSSTSNLAVSTNLNTQDQVSLVAIEVNKLPTRLDYSPNEVISTSGGELRVVYSDYSVRYIPMRDSMIETNRLNISTLGNSSVTLKHQEGSIAKYVTYNVNIVPFTVSVNSVALDIVSSDVLRTQSVQLNPIITPLNGLVRDIKWSSSNPLIARVDNNGLVTPLNGGEVIITVTVNNLYSAASRLNILQDEIKVPTIIAPSIVTINSLILDTIVTAPSSGATPVVAPIDETQFEGTIAWFESNGTTPLTGNFASATVYVAKLNLVAKPNFTLDGVVANSFVYNGATSVTNNANSGLITITFPSQITQVNIAAISGVTAPVTGATPVTTITQSDQFTGTITWSPAVASTFAPATVYTATITLTAKSGFNFAGVTSNFFTVAGATASNTINSGTVTAIFTETNSTVVNIAAISGVTAPVTGATPVTTITQSDQFTGTITWSPAVASTFAAATVYTATITLTPKTGFTFSGVSANFFTVASATATNNINSGSVGAVFTATDSVPSLLVDLDAGNIASYTGTGSIWTNLVDNNNFTISPSGVFDSANGGSIVFNGSTIVALDTLLVANTSYSYEAWVYDNPGSSGARNIISSFSNVFWINGTTLSAGVGGSGSYSLVTYNNFPKGVWKHVAVTFNTSTNTMVLFVDGVQESSASGVNGEVATEFLRIGAHSNAANPGSAVSFWNGRIASVKIYNYALTQNDIQASFEAKKFRFVVTQTNLSLELDPHRYSGTGNLLDTSVNTNNATIDGATFDNAGKFFSFDGINDFMTVADNATIEPTTGSFSLEAWFYPTNVTAGQAIVVKTDGGNAADFGYGLRFNNGTLTFEVGNGNVAASIFKTQIQLNTWHHAIGSYDMAGNYTLYLNGVNVASASSPYNTIKNTISPLNIGRFPGFDQNFYGRIGEVRYYGKALTAQEATNNYNARKFYYFVNPTFVQGSGVSVVGSGPFGANNLNYSFNATANANAFLEFNESSDWAVGTGDYTIEWFSKQTNTLSPRYQTIFQRGVYPNIKHGLTLENGNFSYWSQIGDIEQNTSPAFINNQSTNNVWIHFAIVRRLGITTFYKNGVSFGTYSVNVDISDTAKKLIIGNDETKASTTALNGNISNFRFVKGLAVYQGNFTTPTSNLKAVTAANPFNGSNTNAIPFGATKLLLNP